MVNIQSILPHGFDFTIQNGVVSRSLDTRYHQLTHLTNEPSFLPTPISDFTRVFFNKWELSWIFPAFDGSEMLQG